MDFPGLKEFTTIAEVVKCWRSEMSVPGKFFIFTSSLGKERVNGIKPFQKAQMGRKYPIATRAGSLQVKNLFWGEYGGC